VFIIFDGIIYFRNNTNTKSIKFQHVNKKEEMYMYKSVFIVNNEINLEGCGRLAKCEELINSVCEGHSPVEGCLGLADGVFVWHDNTDDKEAIEDVGEICEYVKISNDVNALYECLIQDYNENLHNILNCNIQDNRVTALVKNKNKNWIYICSAFRDLDGLIQKTRTMVNKNISIDICEVDMVV